MKLSFIVIDDSELDCYIAKKLISHTGKSLGVITFKEAGTALSYLQERTATSDSALTVILLDILMPAMDGFEFLDQFEQLPQEIRNKYFIIAITSSLNKNDIEAIKSSPFVKGVMDKPLQLEELSSILKERNVDWSN